MKNYIAIISLIFGIILSITIPNKYNAANISINQLSYTANGSCEYTSAGGEYAYCPTSIRNCDIYVYNPQSGYYDYFKCSWVKKIEDQFIG